MNMNDHSQIILTSDCGGAMEHCLLPSSQIAFLDELWKLIGGHFFANSLVYSTPYGNTGWTALRAGLTGHIAYHHWDRAEPSLLQLDMEFGGSIDIDRVIEVIRRHWEVVGLRLLSMKGRIGDSSSRPIVHCDNLLRRSNTALGLGPGNHIYLMVDYRPFPRRAPLSKQVMDAGLVDLVAMLGMVGMTPALSTVTVDSNSSRYDGIIGITTSHILLQVDRTSVSETVRLEVFSCKDFAPDIVRSWLVQHFGPAIDAHSVLVDRHPNHVVSEIDWTD